MEAHQCQRLGSDGSCGSCSTAKPWQGNNSRQQDKSTSIPRLGVTFREEPFQKGFPHVATHRIIES